MRNAINLLILLLYSATLSSQVTSDFIKVDQLGYRPGTQKVAMVANPMVGFDAADSFSPGNTYELRNEADGSLAHIASISPWNAGQTHDQSGDQVWWVDFSSFDTPGDYYLYDVQNDVRSHGFSIDDNVYRDALVQAVRAFYYQRCGTPKASPAAQSPWTDTACHVGANQDSDCRLATDPGNAALSKELSGGWHDAGDFNKYVNFSYGPIHQLLSAYEQNPDAFTDDFNIPESGNGVPDILDEVKWELDWLLKMQLADGSVLTKVSTPQFHAASPPSADTEPRYYGEASSSSTRSFCSMTAHAAVVFSNSSDATMQAYGATLLNAATNAWAWLDANTAYSYYGNGGFFSANPEVSEYEQDAMKIGAAGYLFAATNDNQYKTYFDTNYQNMHAMQWTYWFTFESTFQDALLYYTGLPSASTAIVTDIHNSFQYSANTGSGELLVPWLAQTDAYRSYIVDNHYLWGSNRVKSNNGNLFQNLAIYDVDAANTANYLHASEEFVHYLHGANPLGLCMLSNMYNHNCEHSVNEIYHGWFDDQTDYDNALTSLYGPAPGILTGGCNANFQPDASYSGPPLDPPMNQPVQKSYRDWNTNWPENSWEVTEPSITYQAAYVKLLSKFVTETDDLTIDAHCLLEGPYNSNGMMNTDLSSTNLLPNAQPFSASPWNYNGSESMANPPSNTVDWLLLEVWDSSDDVLAQQAVLLMDNGDLQSTSANTQIRLSNVPSNGNYRIALRSRNHLDVISTLRSDWHNSLVDFSDPNAISGGAQQLKQTSDGYYACLAGDFDSNGVNSFLDFNQYLSDSSAILQYLHNDVNMDGYVTVLDFNLYKANSSSMAVMELRY